MRTCTGLQNIQNQTVRKVQMFRCDGDGICICSFFIYLKVHQQSSIICLRQIIEKKVLNCDLFICLVHFFLGSCLVLDKLDLFLVDIVLSFWSLPSKTHKLGIFHSVAKGIEVSFGIFAVDFQWLMIVLFTFNFCPVQFPLSKMPGIMTAQPQSQRLHTCTIKSA